MIITMMTAVTTSGQCGDDDNFDNDDNRRPLQKNDFKARKTFEETNDGR